MTTKWRCAACKRWVDRATVEIYGNGAATGECRTCGREEVWDA